MNGTLKHYVLLNLTVFIWGFTGILGKEIDLDANKIVFFRTGIAFLSLIILGAFLKKRTRLSRKQLGYVLGTGVIVGLHWFTFFQSIKMSTVSVAVVCMSSSTLFTALIEPFIFKRKLLFSEIILSLFIVVGIGCIIGFEFDYILGIMVGLVSALLASFFNVLNGKFIQTMPSFQITKYEMLGGFLTMALVLFFSGEISPTLFILPLDDFIYLLILGLVCTTAAFIVSVWLMKFLSPFTVSMGINMEPIYAIIIALILDYSRGIHSEQMSIGFYVGTFLILGSIFLNAYVKKKQLKAVKI